MRCGFCLGACGVGTNSGGAGCAAGPADRLPKKLLYLCGCGVEEFLTEQTERDSSQGCPKLPVRKSSER